MKRILSYLNSAGAARAAFAILLIAFAAKFISYHSPGTGFTWLLCIGESAHLNAPPRLEQTNYHWNEHGGYDGQFYAQFALYPLADEPGLADSTDNFEFRARRILFSWTAYILGAGDPDRVLQIYSTQNAICWIALAFLLTRWLPPTDLGNVFRISGILFHCGVIVSVQRALLDVPSLTLIALFAYLFERSRPRSAAAVMALAALGKEYSLISNLAFLDRETLANPRKLVRAIAIGAATAVPILLWIAYALSLREAPLSNSAGDGAFNWPFASMANGALNVIGRLPTDPFAKWEAIVIVSLAIQVGYLLIRVDWRSLWWRVAAPHAALFTVLGPAVWGDPVWAASRLALPAAVAFNILAPRTRKFLPLLILGNLSMIPALWIFDTPPPKSEQPAETFFSGRPSLNYYYQTEFSPEWFARETHRDEHWRWASQSAAISISSSESEPRTVQFDFELQSLEPRQIAIRINGGAPLEYTLNPMRNLPLSLPFELLPGTNTIAFDTAAPPTRIETDTRPLAFALRNYTVALGDKR